MSAPVTPTNLQEGNIPEREMTYPSQQPSDKQPTSEGVVTTEGASETQTQCIGEVEFVANVPNATAVNAESDVPISGMWQHSRDYVEHLLYALNQQRGEGIHCDFSVEISGTRFPVHKCVISAGK